MLKGPKDIESKWTKLSKSWKISWNESLVPSMPTPAQLGFAPKMMKSQGDRQQEVVESISATAAGLEDPLEQKLGDEATTGRELEMSRPKPC